ncbi:hypothetical protein CkaCkLH20_10630 [Colletotrichum karsti]|uniref:Nucleoside phosphorylase domain-containing protein n=1 Tax=Colletotrichum karsti TaxID=1095194 RepID=A0A9P6HWA0_9PEZI|nr:uncharacterized protein CkaCkLH20_10630 [Colletotrichum karsti]KAF9871998.1 hypothetical protein CkaCkLH20_10630 [Colletotrichum karsti]
MDIPQPEDYQIGWIYALQLELTAAKVFFDKEYPQPQDAAQNDNNNYVLGRMGKHHIVVAGLPLGQTGNNSAATVLKDMVRSYPNLRFVLMVGIGGGVPNAKNNLREECENEIHLGDVVVSAPSGQHGAVIQYDFGKEHQDRGFEFTGYQNLPSATLLGAIPTLQSNHDIDGTDSLANRIEERLNLKPKLRKTYGRPENKTDKLYSSDFVHVDGNATCNECDETKIIRRGREDEDKVPRVHYGLIASGNKVMRDAKQRDFLAKEKGVLCFEMEAGGLMNSWSCLVVRGICDYSDSHKHKKWQQYSALSAASYARELLDLIPQQRIGGDQKIADQISKDG